MKFDRGLSPYLVLALAAQATALAAPKGHKYIPPTTENGFVRSPCPGLNSLANHGWINRDGKNITVPQLVLGGFPGIGIGQDFMTSIGGLALFSPDVPNGISFDLDDLKEHNFPIEHDASLTRQDYYFHHDDITFRKGLYNQFISHFKGEKTSLKTSAAARYARVEDSLKRNPNVTYGPMAFLFSYGESGLYTQTMGSSPLALGAPVEYVESLFLHERLPYELGWKPSTVPITLVTLGNFVFELFAAGGKEALPVGLEVLTKGSYAEFVAKYLAITQKLHNITGGA